MSDLIDRKTVLDVLRDAIMSDDDIYFGDQLADGYNYGINRAIEEVEKLPSAEPERKTGRWLNGFCSACGKEAVTEWNENGGEYLLSDFCPFCGADMRGDVEND